LLVKKAQRKFPIAIISAALLIAVLVYGIYLLIPVINSMLEKSCSDEICFVNAANSCQSATFQNNLAGSIFEYKTKGCVLTKTAKKMNETEPIEIIRMFEGKSMVCAYDSGGFDDNLITTISVGTENCNGELKTAIDLITIA
jgi:hypothetical protein